MAFLLIGVVPLLISTLLMLNIFRVTLAGNARDAAQAELDGAVRALDTLLGEGVETLHDLAGDGLVCAELSEPGSQSNAMLAAGITMTLFSASAAFRALMNIMADIYRRRTYTGVVQIAASVLNSILFLITIYLSLGCLLYTSDAADE